jgi:hypothetical protein
MPQSSAAAATSKAAAAADMGCGSAHWLVLIASCLGELCQPSTREAALAPTFLRLAGSIGSFSELSSSNTARPGQYHGSSSVLPTLSMGGL